MLKDYCNGSYTQVSLATIVMVAGALFYVFSPIDAVPDFIPFFGLIDDAGVIGALLVMISREFQQYKDWRDDSQA